MSRRRKRVEEHEEHIDESWLIPYADILTLLLALFIVLFASSSINVSKYEAIMNSFKSEFKGSPIKNDQKGLTPNPPTEKEEQKEEKPPEKENSVDPELEALKEKLQKYIADNRLNAVVTLADTRRGVEVSLKDVILFEPGQAVLKGSAFKTLNEITGLLNTVSNPISIEGHTDNVPIGNAPFRSNWELSSARAGSVLHYFASKNIKESRMQFTGYGEFSPLYPNDTAEQRQANRRVNIVILRDGTPTGNTN